MSNAIQTVDFGKIESVLIQGDLARLSAEERLSYNNKVCESLGLNALTRPFEFMSLNGKLVMYAKRDATDQLRRIHNVSVVITSREKAGEVYIVTARATLPNGRTDESTGAVSLGRLAGESLANAYMKAETKAKRRVTLSICGLGALDETEVESIPKDVSPQPQAAAEVSAPAAAPKPAQVIKPAAPKPSSPDPEKASPIAQHFKTILSNAQQRGISVDELSAYVKKAYKVENSKQLTEAQVKDLHTLIADEQTDVKLLRYLGDPEKYSTPFEPEASAFEPELSGPGVPDAEATF